MNGSAVPAALDAAGEVDPNPGVGRDAAGRQPGTPPSRGEGPRYHPWLFNAVWGWLRARFPRIQVRGSGVTGYNWLLGTLRRAGCPAPPSLTVCTDLQRRHEVMPPYESSPVT